MSPLLLFTLSLYLTKIYACSCITDCFGKSSDNYQSCKGCDVYAACSNGILNDNLPCPDTLLWDDSSKSCAYSSTTCPCLELTYKSTDEPTFTPTMRHKPTLKPTFTPTFTPKPTLKPTPIPPMKPTLSPTDKPTPKSTRTMSSTPNPTSNPTALELLSLVSTSIQPRFTTEMTAFSPSRERTILVYILVITSVILVTIVIFTLLYNIKYKQKSSEAKPPLDVFRVNSGVVVVNGDVVFDEIIEHSSHSDDNIQTIKAYRQLSGVTKGEVQVNLKNRTPQGCGNVIMDTDNGDCISGDKEDRYEESSSLTFAINEDHDSESDFEEGIAKTAGDTLQ